jgi:hypothetical protein
VVIRSRLADKMRFLLSGEPPAPTPAQLREYLAANRQRLLAQGSPRQTALSPSFEELEPVLKRQWAADQRERNFQRGIAEIRRKYTVRLPAGECCDRIADSGKSRAPTEAGMALQ